MQACTQAYADDVVVLGVDNLHQQCLMTRGLGKVSEWCERAGMMIYPWKTTVVPFTRRHRLDGLGPVLIEGEQLELSHQMKYLTLDQTLNWEPQLERLIHRGK